MEAMGINASMFFTQVLVVMLFFCSSDHFVDRPGQEKAERNSSGNLGSLHCSCSADGLDRLLDHQTHC